MLKDQKVYNRGGNKSKATIDRDVIYDAEIEMTESKPGNLLKKKETISTSKKSLKMSSTCLKNTTISSPQKAAKSPLPGAKKRKDHAVVARNKSAQQSTNSYPMSECSYVSLSDPMSLESREGTKEILDSTFGPQEVLGK